MRPPANCLSVRKISLCGLALAALSTASSFAAVSYDVRAETKDKVRAYTGSTRQGSFGAPGINDKGIVAYPCILTGSNVNAFSNGSIIMRKKGKRPAQVAVQTGVPVDYSFTDTLELNGNQVIPPASVQFLRFGINVGISNKKRIAFSGALYYEVQNFNDEGQFQNSNGEQVGSFGSVFPLGGGFQTVGLITFLDYRDEILRAPIAVTPKGGLAYSADIVITDNNEVPGIAMSYPQLMGGVWGGVRSTIATTESTVIGLPYFTTFEQFSNGILSKKDTVFLVADVSDDANDYDGIWKGRNVNLQPVVVKGTSAPNGGNFDQFFAPVAPSPNAKLTAFIATTSGRNTGTGIFRCSSNGRELMQVAFTNQKAPGVNANFNSFESVGVNNKGQVAFKAVVDTTQAHAGIWISDRSGKNLTLIALEGNTIPVGEEVKRISSITFNPITGFNRKGQVAFTASFTDRTSAVIVAEIK